MLCELFGGLVLLAVGVCLCAGSLVAAQVLERYEIDKPPVSLMSAIFMAGAGLFGLGLHILGVF